MKKISAILLICTLGISLLAGSKKTVTTPLPAISSSDVSSSSSAPAIIAVSTITLDQTTVTLEVGKTQQLTATVAPDDVTDKPVTFATSDATIATVDAMGLVTAVKAGTCTITAASSDGLITATCNITINAPPATQPASSTSSKAATSSKSGSSSTSSKATSSKSFSAASSSAPQWNPLNNPSTPEPAKDSVSEADLASNGYWKYEIMHLYWEWAQPSGASSPQWEGNTSTICHMTDAQKYEVYLDIAAVYPQPTQPGTIGQTTEHKAFCVYIGEGHI